MTDTVAIWPMFLPLLLLPLFLLPLLVPKADNLAIFAPIPPDPGIVRMQDDFGTPKEGSNYVWVEFEREIDVNLETGECLLNYKNPGQSNHKVVVQLQLTDAEAVKIMGSTGRTAEVQKKLDSNPRYNPKNNRIVIAESGAVPPGYRLDNLKLTAQPNGATIPPGEYKATAFVIPYDINSDDRGMVDIQYPVVITVHK